MTQLQSLHFTQVHRNIPDHIYCLGFEALGTVIAVGSKVQRLKAGDSVFVGGNGCFSEYLFLSEKLVSKVPFLMTELLPIFGSGLTASIGLDIVGEMKSNETVLVTGNTLFSKQN